MNLLTLGPGVCLAACIVVKLEMKRSSRLTEGSSFRTKSAAASLGDLDGRIRKERLVGEILSKRGHLATKQEMDRLESLTHATNKPQPFFKEF